MGHSTRVLTASLAIAAIVAYAAASFIPAFFIQVPFVQAEATFSFWQGFPWICIGGAALVLVTAILPLARPSSHTWAAPLLAAAVLTLFAAFWWDAWSHTNWSEHRTLEESAFVQVVLLSAVVLLLSCESFLTRRPRS